VLHLLDVCTETDPRSGVVTQQENYKRSGFVLAYRNVRYGRLMNFGRTKPNSTITMAGVSSA
jgi:hypothetical protein